MKMYRHWIIKYIFEHPFKIRGFIGRLYIALYTAYEISKYGMYDVSYSRFVLYSNLNKSLRELKNAMKNTE